MSILLSAALVMILPFTAGTGLGVPFGWAGRWFVGMLVLGAVIMLGHALQAPPAMGLVAVALIALVPFGIGLRLRREARLSPRERGSLVLLAAILIVPAVCIVLHTLDQPVGDWDAMAIWLPRARSIFYGSPLAEQSMPTYPELGPAWWMLASRVVGFAHENVGRLFFAAVLIVWLAALGEMLGRRLTLIGVAAVPFAAFYLFFFEPQVSGMQDMQVNLVAGFAACVLFRLLTNGLAAAERRELLFAGFVSAAPALVKQEGLVWSLILIGTFSVIAFLRAPRQWRLLARLLPSWIGTLAFWPVMVKLNGLDPSKVQSTAFTPNSILAAFDQGARWGLIRPYFVDFFAHHSPLFVSAAVGTLAAMLLAPRLRAGLVFLWAAVGLWLAFCALAFFSTTQDLAWHLATAFARLALQSTMMMVLVLYATLVGLARALLGAVHEVRWQVEGYRYRRMQ